LLFWLLCELAAERPNVYSSEAKKIFLSGRSGMCCGKLTAQINEALCKVLQRINSDTLNKRFWGRNRVCFNKGDRKPTYEAKPVLTS
jgi:hypothetical protein